MGLYRCWDVMSMVLGCRAPHLVRRKMRAMTYQSIFLTHFGGRVCKPLITVMTPYFPQNIAEPFDTHAMQIRTPSIVD